MVEMGHLVHMPVLIARGRKGTMTKFARTLEPNIVCEYESVSDQCCVVKVDFEKRSSYEMFVKKFWGPKCLKKI